MYGLHLSHGIGTMSNKDLAIKVLGKSCKYGAHDEACIYGTRLREELLEQARKKQLPK